jgi:short-subunit dehydrogenase
MFMFKNLAILGASRGLGAAVGKFAFTHLSELETILVVSRKIELLDKVKIEIKEGSEAELRKPFKGELGSFSADFSKLDDTENVIKLIDNKYDLVVYCAGGGPHGAFENKQWRDHRWSLDVNLISPMTLAHAWLRQRPKASGPGRFVIVGSRIAEQNPDPHAASYAAGKHGLYGFVSSLQSELEEGPNKVWLFSPGYIDTALLPTTAKVRHDGSKLMSAETAAQGMLRWLKKDGPWHRVLN